jgi:hypothetical protein
MVSAIAPEVDFENNYNLGNLNLNHCCWCEREECQNKIKIKILLTWVRRGS